MLHQKNLTLALAMLAIASASSLASAQNYNVVAQSQRDSRWANQKLGFSTVYTIGDSGCAVTSYSMILTSLGLGYDPSSANAMLKARNAFNGANVVWGAMPHYAGYLNYNSVPANIGTIQSYLNAGYRMMAETRSGSTRSQTHYVVVNGVTSGGDLMIVDPWYGDRILFSQRYGSPTCWVYSVRLYR